MFDWFKNSTDSSRNNGNTSESANIRVVGDRASGKSTYMAALARWPNANPISPVQTVIPINEDGNDLLEKAQNVLEQGLQLEPTRIVDDVDVVNGLVLKDYQLRIVLKDTFSWRNPRLNGDLHQIMLDVNCKDYSGEFFSDLLNRGNDPILDEYLDDCIQASGIMLLVDGTSRKYQDLTNSIDKFLMALDRSDMSGIKRRIALVITKCEQPDLWVNRYNPKNIAKAVFPQVFHKLEAWQHSQAGNIEYFSTSAFGMLGTHMPAPNFTKVRASRDGLSAVLRDPKRWRPFGLVAPVYWLCTGQKHKELEKD
jgi:GTPase SAR1 family protein